MSSTIILFQHTDTRPKHYLENTPVGYRHSSIQFCHADIGPTDLERLVSYCYLRQLLEEKPMTSASGSGIHTDGKQMPSNHQLPGV